MHGFLSHQFTTDQAAIFLSSAEVWRSILSSGCSEGNDIIGNYIFVLCSADNELNCLS